MAGVGVGLGGGMEGVSPGDGEKQSQAQQAATLNRSLCPTTLWGDFSFW